MNVDIIQCTLLRKALLGQQGYKSVAGHYTDKEGGQWTINQIVYYQQGEYVCNRILPSAQKLQIIDYAYCEKLFVFL